MDPSDDILDDTGRQPAINECKNDKTLLQRLWRTYFREQNFCLEDPRVAIILELIHFFKLKFEEYVDQVRHVSI